MSELKPVLIAGAGPVEVTAATALVRQGIAVQVLEAGARNFREDARLHLPPPPTLDMLDTLDHLGAAPEMIPQGIIGPRVQYRRRDQSLIAEFDFGLLADVTPRPLPAAMRAIQTYAHPARHFERQSALFQPLQRSARRCRGPR